MLTLASTNTINSLKSTISSVDSAMAVIEFQMDGTIITANKNFLAVMGYSLDEIRGKHHSMFVPPETKDSADYRQFWDGLRQGKYQKAQYKRIGKGGREVWLEASYNPILSANAKPLKVMKIATDVTAQKMDYANLVGQMEAIGRAQAVIEFNVDGTVITANPNFLKTMGYSLEDIRGKHHSMFVSAEDKNSAAYKTFWEMLRRGDYQAAQYKRIAKGGREVWLEASYNPVFDLGGKLVKVVKFATDITAQIQLLASLKRLIDVNFAEIDGALDRSNTEVSDAAKAATETSGNVQMLASSAEELDASIKEISESMTKSKGATDKAFDQVTLAGESTQRLVDAAKAMGGVVQLIQAIAGQINMLALNATIESARAGDAGKGFAVVATEVKNLANQAARATEQISREIENVQAVSGEVASSLTVIQQAIDTVREYVSGTASAVEEQSAVTRGMSANMQDASSAVSTITENINQISVAVLQANDAVVKTKEAAQVLAR